MTLRHKINAAILVTFLIVSVLFASILLPFQKRRLQDALGKVELLLQTLVERDSEELANEIFDSRRKAIKIRLKQMLNVDGVLGICVFDQSGRLLIAEGSTKDVHQLNEIQIKRVNNKTQQIEWDDSDSLLFKKEISFLGEKVGLIHIHYSMKSLKDDQRNSIILFGSILAVLLAVMITSLNLILSKAIISPINSLMNATRLISEGDYGSKVTTNKNDEIGSLAWSFEKMRIAVNEKISDLKKSQKELGIREERLRLITDNMVDIITQTDPQINFVYNSPSIEKILGYHPQDLEGKSAVDYIHPDDIDRIIEEAKEARKKRIPSVLVQYRWRNTSGDYVWLESTTRLLYDEEGHSRGAIFGTRDITERIQLEKERSQLQKQLMQTQKLESIGHLAGGVAHDLNNLLSPILGYTELLLCEKLQDDLFKGKLEQIHKAGLGARDLVRQLLAFGRKQTLEYRPLDLNKTIKAYEKLIRRTIPADIEIQLFQSDKIKPILADAGQIEQVIMNLSINAADAMPNGGKLTFETELVDLDDSYVAKHTGVTAGMYVMFSVSDTGCGMDEETQTQIFDPFFSTKGKKGTGLGLATVYGIIKQHDGNIWVYSEPGNGTTIKVYLPVNDDVQIKERVSSLTETDNRGEETILLVEDNKQVRDLAQTILAQQGYTVLIAEAGSIALNEMKKYGGPIHLLLADVVLPDMNGKQVYEQVVKHYPDIKVLYMSGYTNNVIAHRGVLDEGVNFIQKPFSVRALGSKVRKALDFASLDDDKSGI